MPRNFLNQVLNQVFNLTKFSKIKILVLSLLMFFSSHVFAFDGDSRVQFQTISQSPTKAGKYLFEFTLLDSKLGTQIGTDTLKTSHERKLHLLVYDPSLNEFEHVHPDFIDNKWQVELNFAVNGNYWVWGQGVLAADGSEFSAVMRLAVTGGDPEWPTPPNFIENRYGVDSTSSNNGAFSTAQLSPEKLKAGEMAMLNVLIGHTDGSTPDITPYLGAFAHVLIVPVSGDSLIHVHPMGGSLPYLGMIHTEFPKPGMYRVWVQFLDSHVLKTVSLAVEVF